MESSNCVCTGGKRILELSFAMHISVPENVLMRELEGESVILNVDTERYFGLDDMGTRMLTVLTASDSIQSAYNALLEEYDVEPEKLRQDIHNFIEKLVEHGLLDASSQ